MSLTSIFNRSLDGLNVAQQGLAVASNNIANVNTKGYARQQMVVGSRATVAGNDPSLGGGVEVTGLNSVTSSFIERQLFNTVNQFGTVDGRQQTLSQLEQVFNESQDQGLNKNLNDFFNSFSDLANNPTSIPSRQAVKDKATTLTSKFNSMSSQLSSMKRDLSTEISTRLTTINGYASQIAKLNQSIVAAGGPDKAQDLAAQRTYDLQQLSQEVNVSYFQDSSGSMQVQLGSGGPLVEGYNSGTLSVSNDDLSNGGTIAIQMQFAGSSSTTNVTSQITSGRLGGNMIDRNTTINGAMTNLDNLAYQLSTQFNASYSTGYGLDSSTGNNFFTPLASATGAAANLSVDASVSNPQTIAAAQQDPTVSGKGDNRKALTLQNIQNSLTMNSGTVTFSQNYQAMIGSIGVMVNTVNQDVTNKTNLLNQMQTQRESVSGVNMDEEGANIIQYQKAFEAASKLMSLADSMMDELLKIGT
ncbi:MAG: Flagellar hook-associated protein 1 [Bacteriovoracaceae bacterium]|nr:Flagellar hook-associated protein 1 [Bacteriovoracaceae bacterium]